MPSADDADASVDEPLVARVDDAPPPDGPNPAEQGAASPPGGGTENDSRVMRDAGPVADSAGGELSAVRDGDSTPSVAMMLLLAMGAAGGLGLFALAARRAID